MPVLTFVARVMDGLLLVSLFLRLFFPLAPVRIQCSQERIDELSRERRLLLRGLVLVSFGVNVVFGALTYGLVL